MNKGLFAVCMLAASLAQAGEPALTLGTPTSADTLDGERAEGVDELLAGRGGVSAVLMGGSTVANNVTTYNIIGDGAFSEASGLISVIQNTGNNVIIQDSTVVNLSIHP